MFIPAILILPSLIEFSGVIFSQTIADVFTTILTVMFAVNLVKKLINTHEEKIELRDVRLEAEL